MKKRKYKAPIFWTESDCKFLLDNWGKMTVKELADHFDRHTNTVSKKYHQLMAKLDENGEVVNVNTISREWLRRAI